MDRSVYDYTTAGGLRVTREVLPLTASEVRERLASALDTKRGVWLASSYEYPGRYKRFDLGFSDPPLVLEARGRRFSLQALNERGVLLLPVCRSALAACPDVAELARLPDALVGEVPATTRSFAEESRTRQPSVFSAVRALCAWFASPEDALLGLYGAFGYDLVFQLEALRQLQPRAAEQRDLVLYLPDRLLVIDHERGGASQHSYEFEHDGVSTRGLPRETAQAPFAPAREARAVRDHAPGEF
ncbi:MAG TPA: anthranilate synthase component I, partial [Polyangiales bacterium]|nr:anthranilate synthase component I [Polyangiales bacterium]